MPAKSLHAYYVDRRLSVARQQLSMVSADGEQTLTLVFIQGCIDSALLQTYFAVAHYVNELLESYQQPAVQTEGFQLRQILLHYTGNVSDLLEWKQLAATPESWLAMLLSLPEDLLVCGSEPVAALDNKKTKATSVVSEDSESHLQVVLIEENSNNNVLSKIALTEHTAQWIISECSQLIQRQREHLFEC